MSARLSYRTFLTVCICGYLLVIHGLKAFSQDGSEWIVPGQSYYKIETYKDGMYALPSSTLQAAGINTIDLTNLQLWHRGNEQACLISNDTLFFYGKRNDGTLDSLLYFTGLQPHKYYNLHSDTAAYFLTMAAQAGKRIATNTISVAAAADAWYYQQELSVYKDKYYTGIEYSIETKASEWDLGEGWFGPAIVKSTGAAVLKSYTIPISNALSVSQNAEIELLVCGVNESTHVIDLLIGDNSSAPDFRKDSIQFVQTETSTFKLAFPSGYLAGKTQLTIYLKVYGYGQQSGFRTENDAVAPGYIKLTYPRSYVYSNSTTQFIHLPDNGNQDRKIKFTTGNANLLLLDRTDEFNQSLIGYTFASNAVTAGVPASVKEIIILPPVYLSVSKFYKVDLTIPDYTSEYYILYPSVFQPSSLDYAAYRASTAGGGYDTLRVTFENLCNLYSYGEFTPTAIRRFCTNLTMDPTPKFLLILGKGLVVSNSYYFVSAGGVHYNRSDPGIFLAQTDNKIRSLNLIPTYGSPGSDLMYSVNSSYIFQIPTGRVSAKTNADVHHYLAKVVTHEQLDSNLIWRKHLLHISGGKNPGEIDDYHAFVDQLKAIAEGDYFGGKVIKTYVKDIKNGAVDDQLKTNIADQVNEGISFLTFFGHSSAEVIDVDIGEVSNPLYGYKKVGKYPMLLVNGCSSADIFTNYSFAEDWIITDGLGAINVLGHSDVGYSLNLKDYSRRYYYFQFQDQRYRNSPVGIIHQRVVDTLLTNVAFDWANVAQCVQMNLSGDPALRQYPTSKPDYAIYGDNDLSSTYKCALASFSSNFITAKDSFKIIIPVENYGSTTHKIVDLVIKRYVNNVLVKNYQFLVNPVDYIDSLIFTIQNNDGNYVGENHFDIFIDYNDSLKEMRETNNFASLSYYMPLSAVKCLYPVNYSIVFNQPVSLIAQPTNLLIEQREYYFELDTTKEFNSLYKQSSSFMAGSLPTWTPSLISDVLPSDSIVYFWRVRFKDVQATEDTIWDYSSFIYIKNSKPGWSQTTVAQFLEDDINGMTYRKDLHLWEFRKDSITLYVNTVGVKDNNASTLSEISINNLPILINSVYNSCTGVPGGVLIMVLDQSTLKPKVFEPNPENWVYCGQNFDTKYLGVFGAINNYELPDDNYSAASDGKSMIDFLSYADSNDYILIMSNGDSYVQYWDSRVKDYYNDTLKVPQITSLQNGQPFIILTKKSASQALSVTYDNTTVPGGRITLDTLLKGNYTSATVTTPLIGPASQWGKLYFGIDSLPGDIVSLKLIRFNTSGTVIDTVSLPKTDSLDLVNSYLTDGVHAYCKLLLTVSDSTQLTPAVLEKWQIIYNGVPEGTMNPSYIGLDAYMTQVKQEGDTIYVQYAFDNISDFDFSKPVKVVFTIRNESGAIKYDTIQYSLLPSKQRIVFTYKRSTKGLVGVNYLQAYVNPQFQAEQYYTNNILESSFTVQADKTQPVMEVSFDGVKIFDGDIVSANPLINISLRDNNKYLLMQDPSSVEVFLKDPQGNLTAISSADPSVLSWSLDNAKTNTFVAEIKPKGLADGTYSLIVQGKDASGNKSGTNKYEIRFMVVNKPSVTYFYPYPNPFSTSTRFVFTLTGNKVPDNIKIQIMTVTGTVVREILKDELGPLHIGNNISEYAWNGTDEYGDKLANGVYLYRVIIKDSEQYFEHSNSAGDKAFHKDFGKLYILR